MFRRPKVIIVSLVVVTGLFLILLPSRLNDQLKWMLSWVYLPLVGVADGVEGVGHRSRAYLTPRSRLLAENDRLRRENRQLRVLQFQSQVFRRENARLRSLVEWRAQHEWNLKLARVIIEDPANWWRGVVLNIGMSEGVQVDDPVVTEEGLVGKVISVSGNRSRVALLGDANCKVAAVLGNSSQGGIVLPSAQNAVNRQVVELKHLPSDAELEPGMEIFTSGAGGVFPRGIPIGRLIDSQTYNFGLYSGARIRLRADLDQLDLVWVIVRGETGEGRG
jgi:rod shape-determining protein MreC